MSDLIERMAKAIFDAENGIDGDTIGTILHENFRVEVAGDDKGLPATMDLCRTIARAALAAQQDGAWQPIETAPKDGTRVLVCDGGDVATSEFTNRRWIVSPTAWDGCGETGGLADLDFTPTHWMPTPAPPQS